MAELEEQREQGEESGRASREKKVAVPAGNLLEK
jgi:hypothetical protein